MTLVVIKVNDQFCRAVIATNFTHSFCGSPLVKALGLDVHDLANPPAAATSDGTPIEFLGEARVQLELGPWQSDGMMPLLVAWDCPADVLIGDDLIKEISKKFPVKFEFYKNAVNIGGTRVSMLDPLAAEEKFISVVVMDPHSNKEVGMEMWKKGNKEAVEPGGLVKRRVEVVKGQQPEASSQEVEEEASREEPEMRPVECEVQQIVQQEEVQEVCQTEQQQQENAVENEEKVVASNEEEAVKTEENPVMVEAEEVVVDEMKQKEDEEVGAGLELEAEREHKIEEVKAVQEDPVAVGNEKEEKTTTNNWSEEQEVEAVEVSGE